MLFRWTKWLFVGLIFLLIISYFLFQNGSFQTWAAKKLTTKLSTDLNAEVSIGQLDIDFFNKLLLKDFFIEDQKGDTLLYSRELNAELSANLISILNNKYDIDDIYLKDAIFNLRKEKGAKENNLQFIIDALRRQDENSQKKRKPLYLDIDGLHLENVTFFKDDNVQGGLMTVQIPVGDITFNDIDVQTLLIDIKDVNFQQPVVDLTDRKRYLPEEEDKTSDEIVEKTQEEVPDSLQPILVVKVDQAILSDAKFNFKNLRKAPRKISPASRLDFNHLQVYNINIDIENYQFTEGKSTGRVNGISLEESSGFVLEKLSSKNTTVSDRRIELYDMQLKTPYSDLGDTLVMKYRSYADFLNFKDKVLMDTRFKDAKLALKDLIVFAPKLAENAFFGQNSEEVLAIDGVIKGRVNNLRGRKLKLNLGDNMSFAGDFSSRNLAVKNEELLNLEVDRLLTDMRTLRLLVPNFSPPANFNKLGNLDFHGRFDGFFIDFVAYGNLKTDLGDAEMDMRMDLRQGRQDASYSGGLSLTNFNLKNWSGNKDLGNITFTSKVEDGFGLTIDKVNAKVFGNIESFTFRDYTYKNVNLDGTLNKNLFDGKLEVKDDNIDFTFDGNIEMIDTIPKFDFAANINHLDLKSLNLIKDDFVFSGEVDLELLGFDLSNLRGEAKGYNIKAVKNGNEEFAIDSLLLSSKLIRETHRVFKIDSEILKLDLQGEFDVISVPEALLQMLEQNHPEFADRFNVRSKKRNVEDVVFHYDLLIPNSKNITHLIHPNLDTIYHLSMQGYFDNQQDSLSVDLELPQVAYADLTFQDIIFQYEMKDSVSALNLEVYNTQTGNLDIEPISVYGDLTRDTFNFEVNATNWSSLLDNLNIAGRFFLAGENFEVQFLPSDLEILKDRWFIDADNHIRFGKNYMDTKNFDLTNGDFRIKLEAFDNKGLEVQLENFNLSLIDEYWVDERMDFDGKFDVTASVSDFYTMKDMSLTLIADTLDINGDDWGLLRVDAHTPDLNSSVDTYVSITKGQEQLIAEGEVYLPTMPIAKERNFDVDIDISHIPFYLLEYFLGHAISNTYGWVDGKLVMGGRFNAPDINGTLRIYDAAVKVDYLQTTYYINDADVKVDPYIFDGTGAIIRDSLGNEAVVTGGVTHDHVKAWGIDARIVSDEFLILNTRKVHNPVYYGYAIGAGDIRFTGPFEQINISIDATTGKDTRIIIPITDEQEAEEVSFITFINTNDADSIGLGTINADDLRGISLGMNLTMTEDAEVLLIFDEKAGDIIQGRGIGDLQLFLSRTGNMSMFGNYEITEGEYLFTFYNFLNKPFTIVPGGTIDWDGDPFNAKLDIVANYKGVRTSMTNFVADYLSTEELKQDARQPTDVDLGMVIRGELVQPDIDFDIAFPDLVGQIKNYADSRLRIIRLDQGELNRQVFGLIIIGGFLPSSNSSVLGVDDAVSGIQNSLSEVITSQLSIITTELLSEFVTDIDFISGVDFEVDYNVYDAELVDGAQIRQGSEVGVRPAFDLLDDRLTVELGFTYSQFDQSSFLANDFAVEWALSANRRLTLRAYNRSDNTVSGARNRTGLGLTYRRGFNSFKELFERKAKRQEQERLNAGGQSRIFR